MKQYIQYLLLLGICSNAFADIDSGDFEATGRSYLAVHPQGHTASPELLSGFRADFTHKGCFKGGFQAVIFGGKSRNSEDLARYFLPNGKTELLVGEQNNIPNSAQFPDILADNIGIQTVGDNFLSRISIRPKQSVVGGILEWRQNFTLDWFDNWFEEGSRGFWFDIILPIERVKNTLNFTETIVNTGNNNTPITTTAIPTFSSATAAFRQERFQFAKLDTHNGLLNASGAPSVTDEAAADAMKVTRLADMEIKLGIECLKREKFHLESYLGLVLPTGNKPKGEYLFEAVAGYGKHVGLMWGSNLGFSVWHRCDHHLCVEVASHSQYLFKKKQMRTYDLMNKPWSRYLPMYANLADAQAAAALAATDPFGATLANTPGVNILTLETDVKPGFSYNQNTALVYKFNGFQAEFGYNFLARASEVLELSNPFAETAAIKDVLGVGGTRPIADITGNIYLLESTGTLTTPPGFTTPAILPEPVANYNRSIIRATDLDLKSAATPTNLAHTVYGALGYGWDDMEFPMFVNLGGGFTFSRSNNAVVERWTVWGKFGIAF